MHYIPNTDRDREEMLRAIGVRHFEELLRNIPKALRSPEGLRLPEPLSELEVSQLLGRIAEENKSTQQYLSFLGGGAYDHFIPAAVGHIISRPEFYTAYTPYQPEVSQGTLQAIYEYQSMICELTGMDVANASLYDGGSALGEAALMAHSETGRKEILVSKTVHPFYRRVLRTYCHGQGIRLVEIPQDEGITDLESLKAHCTDQTAGVILQHPNFFGCLEEMAEAEKIIHKVGALFITSNDPISLGLLVPPGEYGADIVTGEGQALGNAQNFGGPYLGLFAVRQQLVRKMPGRLAGMTVDRKGQRGFVLTLQTREQHIRREKATSNICTNQALMALAATVYMALMGPKGMAKVAELCLQKSHYLGEQISKIPGFSIKYSRPFFKEFVIKVPIPPREIIRRLLEKKIFAGIDLGEFDFGLNDGLLVCVTEKRTKDEIDAFVNGLRQVA